MHTIRQSTSWRICINHLARKKHALKPIVFFVKVLSDHLLYNSRFCVKKKQSAQTLHNFPPNTYKISLTVFYICLQSYIDQVGLEKMVTFFRTGFKQSFFGLKCSSGYSETYSKHPSTQFFVPF